MYRLFSVLLILSCFCACHKKVPISAVIDGPIRLVEAQNPQIKDTSTKRIDSLNIDFQLRGFIHAISDKKNFIPSGGEWQSSNVPKSINDKMGKLEPGLSLVIDESELIVFGGRFHGHKLLLINNSSHKMSFMAQDSRLNIIAEALDSTGAWKPIVHLPSSRCGNSYHNITLGKFEFWQFESPVFKGNFQTKLRYKLMFENDTIFSNEIKALLNHGQLDPERRMGFIPQSIMDPYTE